MVRLLLLALVLAVDPSLRTYLNLTDAQQLRMSALTEEQKAKLPALEEVLQVYLARSGAISLGLIGGKQEVVSCWCWGVDSLVKRLGLTSEQLGGIRGRAGSDRLSVLKGDQVSKLEALKALPALFEAANEAARLGLFADPLPRGECLCP
jgi:hypothetical protein